MPRKAVGERKEEGRKLTIPSHESHKFSQVWETTEWRDGYSYKVKSIGYILTENKENYPPDKYTLSSISTTLTRGRYCTLHPFLGDLREEEGGN